MVAVPGVPADFAGFVFDDWSGRGGKDAAGNDRRWLNYATTRWSRERAEWMAGTHKGNKTPGPASNGIGERTLAEKELVRVERGIADILNGYSDHQAMSAIDAEKVKPLRARRKELKAKLGFIA
jgi:hypothetical protein